jgi:hypothetical protein
LHPFRISFNFSFLSFSSEHSFFISNFILSFELNQLSQLTQLAELTEPANIDRDSDIDSDIDIDIDMEIVIGGLQSRRQV